MHVHRSHSSEPWATGWLGALLLAPILAVACATGGGGGGHRALPAPLPGTGKIELDEAAWLARLGPERFEVLREGGTEPAFSSDLWKERRDGVYRCAACNQVVYRSADKYDPGTGWPSFTRPARPEAIETRSRTAFGAPRVEVLCARCGSHLGFVYDDGPAPTGLRHSINGLSLVFEPAKKPRPTRPRR